MQHPDEGTIHAWLDGALGSDEARALEAHVAGCPACAAAVTEARGLLAASSRILAALDAVPGGVLPAVAPDLDDGVVGIAPRGASRWRSPGLRAAAAIVLVGSVSWLATRSTPTDVVTAARSDTIAEAAATPGQATAPSVMQQAAAPDREVGAQRASVNATSGAAAAKPTAPATPSNAAPLRRAVVPNDGAVGQPAGAGSSAMADAATSAATPRAPVPAPPNGATGGAATLEARAPAPASTGSVGRMLSEAKTAAVPSLMQQPAARMRRENAAELVQLPLTDSDAARLAGCYLLEATHTATGDTTSVAFTSIPTAIELSTTLDSLTSDRARVLRPAPGARPFAAGTRATWTMLGPSVIRIHSSDAVSSLSETLVVKGDSLIGEAAITSAANGTTRAAVRGARTSCKNP